MAATMSRMFGRMGGLKVFMPVTFLTYAIGMLALAGFPLVFSGFWSKDEILHAAHGWTVSHWPFYMGLAGALLTAFYMTRQVALVFFGRYRGAAGGVLRWMPRKSFRPCTGSSLPCQLPTKAPPS